MENNMLYPSLEEISIAYHSSYQYKRKVDEVRIISRAERVYKLIIEYEIVFHTKHSRNQVDHVFLKIYENKSDVEKSYQMNHHLWMNGFQSANYSIARPLHYFQSYQAIMTEKMRGEAMLSYIMSSTNTKIMESIFRVAYFLTKLHQISCPKISSTFVNRSKSNLENFYHDLVELIPSQKTDIEAVYNMLLHHSQHLKDENTTFLHGDFHVDNIFVNEGQVTVIDLDDHFRGDCAWDVAYFLSQMHVRSYLVFGDFDQFNNIADCFLNAYLLFNPQEDPNSFHSRLAFYSSRSLFECLHYEICILKKKEPTLLQDFIQQCQRYINKKKN
ncbi:aminoglycoside phosphotransferase family protein [Hazenella sp. IB182353]|uniref:phosphotransferase n=1 Tax=Polycladospora coralii TaxID=2771432 RepID=UPI00174713FB|nr:aminoglycoside phosphotransferase family protein [Polycladospora coralii]MBS7531913.1 aminoglycoside phosphotransferase family protein [Polycladospora coralii]